VKLTFKRSLPIVRASDELSERRFPPAGGKALQNFGELESGVVGTLLGSLNPLVGMGSSALREEATRTGLPPSKIALTWQCELLEALGIEQNFGMRQLCVRVVQSAADDEPLPAVAQLTQLWRKLDTINRPVPSTRNFRVSRMSLDSSSYTPRQMENGLMDPSEPGPALSRTRVEVPSPSMRSARPSGSSDAAQTIMPSSPGFASTSFARLAVAPFPPGYITTAKPPIDPIVSEAQTNRPLRPGSARARVRPGWKAPTHKDGAETHRSDRSAPLTPRSPLPTPRSLSLAHRTLLAANSVLTTPRSTSGHLPGQSDASLNPYP